MNKRKERIATGNYVNQSLKIETEEHSRNRHFLNFPNLKMKC